MPWLALPFRDECCKKLRRVFKLSRNYEDDPNDELVIIGPHAEFIEPFGANILFEYGISAYPFTFKKALELETEKIKHLKLEMLWDKNTVFRRNNGSQASEATEKVNSWVEMKTNGLVKDPISPGSLDHDTKIIFANVIYFKGFWTRKFDMLKRSTNDFHLLDDSSVRVPFMTSYRDYYCISAFDGFKVLELPYDTHTDILDISMYLFLPDAKDGLSSLVDKLASESEFLERHIPRDYEVVGQASDSQI